MIKNYLKIALRNIIRHKSFSIINISGLAIGLACFILIILWVQDELSYDRFHENTDHIFRVVYHTPESHQVATHGPLGNDLQAALPEVMNSTRVFSPPTGGIVRYKDKVFYSKDDRTILADPSFFDMFTFPFIKGDPKTALLYPTNMVITESVAQKYFGDEDPMGKTLIMNDTYHFKITGILKDVPPNSHLQFDTVVPFILLKYMGFMIEDYHNQPGMTYLQLNVNANAQDLNKKITDFVRQYQHLSKLKISLQPLTKIYLHSNFSFENAKVSDIKYVYIFLAIAIFVLLIACINFTNLCTARSMIRAKEVGVRKVVGAKWNQLIKQFLNESILFALIAQLIAITVVELFLPAFNQFTGKNLAIHYLEPKWFLTLTGIVLFTGIMSGFYPAIYLSSFMSANILKGNIPFIPRFKNTSKVSMSNAQFRKALVICQFAFSIILIIGIMIIHHQLIYLKNKRLGFDKENMLYIPLMTMGPNYESLQAELLKNPNILGTTISINLPHLTNYRTVANWEGKDPEKGLLVNYKYVAHNFFNVLNTQILKGRYFSKEIITDASEAYVLNEEAIRQTELISPIGKWFSLDNRRGKIVGVIENAYFKSLHKKIEPEVYCVLDDFMSRDAILMGTIYIKLNSIDIPATIKFIEKVWKEVNPKTPFEFHFLDALYDELYGAEQRMGKIFNYFALLAIVIACLGLFGLASFMTERRTKEIGIRKVLGASVLGLIAMLSKDFTKWVLISNIIAWPVAYFAMNKWLQNFAYRINIEIWMFILAGVIVLVIALLTVSYQAIKGATANPVEALRYE